jgi:amino acid transporter
MALTNCLFVRVFGELEFGFALLKIALVFVANIMAVVIIAGGGPNGDAPGFRYWKGWLLSTVVYDSKC